MASSSLSFNDVGLRCRATISRFQAAENCRLAERGLCLGRSKGRAMRVNGWLESQPVRLGLRAHVPVLFPDALMAASLIRRRQQWATVRFMSCRTAILAARTGAVSGRNAALHVLHCTLKALCNPLSGRCKHFSAQIILLNFNWLQQILRCRSIFFIKAVDNRPGMLFIQSSLRGTHCSAALDGHRSLR